MIGSISAYAGIDLVGAIDETSIKFYNYDSGGGYTFTDIAFEVEVTNNGDEIAEDILYLKPAMFSLDRADHVRGAQGATLESQGYFISLSAGETTKLYFQQTLPQLPTKNYGLFVILNSRSTIQEVSQINNNTKVVGLGQVGAQMPRKPIGFDFYSEITSGQVRNIRGRASSGFRTVGKGDLSYFPSSEIGDNNLWARFLLYDYQTQEVHTMIYSGTDPAKVEKRWCCLPWRNEVDVYGDAIGVDYYSQAPLFNHVGPGDYLYLSVINSRDLIQEDTLANNLDMFPFNISVLSTKEKRVWFSVNENDLAPISKKIKITTDYSDLISYKTIIYGSNAISVDVPIGDFSREKELTLTLDPSAMDDIVDKKATLQVITFFNGAFHKHEVPLSIFISKESDTIVHPLEITVPVIQAQFPETQKVLLENTGTEVVNFVVDSFVRNNDWLRTPDTEYVLMPGQSVEVDLEIDPFAKGPGSHSGYLTIHTSNSNTPLSTKVYANIVTN